VEYPVEVLLRLDVVDELEDGNLEEELADGIEVGNVDLLGDVLEHTLDDVDSLEDVVVVEVLDDEHLVQDDV
jgi:hypothetical protein